MMSFEQALDAAVTLGALTPAPFPNDAVRQCWVDRIACASSTVAPVTRQELVLSADAYSGRHRELGERMLSEAFAQPPRPRPIRRVAGHVRTVEFDSLAAELATLLAGNAGEGEV